jgi:hypothetical protein
MKISGTRQGYSEHPAPFKPLGADIQVNFAPHRRDPGNNPSIGVTRTASTVTEFGLDNSVKFNVAGGHDAWIEINI